MKAGTAVIPAAGLGTRFLPTTRSVPKVLLPVVDTPVIHLAVAEAAAAGIGRVVVVVSPGQEAVAGYFREMPGLEEALRRRGREELLDLMAETAGLAEVESVVQEEALGLGNAVLMSRPLVGDEPFAVILPDDVIWGRPPTIGVMAEMVEDKGGSVIAVREASRERLSSLGVVDAVPAGDRLYEVRGVVEKPRPEEAPSNLAIVGRYVLAPEVFDLLESTPPGAGGEVQLTDAIAALLPSQRVYAYRFPGVHVDVGTPSGLLKASIYESLQRPELAEEIRAWFSGLA
jgi:UTP--glucose-1-phosphate uridylyltransferase